ISVNCLPSSPVNECNKVEIKAIKADSKRFADWCSERGVPSLPADPDTLRACVDWGAEEFKPATVKRHLASIAHLHRAARLLDPAKDNKVRLAVKRMNRTKGTRQKQARGLTMVDAAIIRSKVEGTVRDTRDVAMILVARDILARSSELVAMNREDVQFDEDGAGTVLIRKSKTDQEGMGAQRWISPDTVQALKKWLLIAGIDKGAMFQAVTKGGNVKRGTRLSTTDVYRSIQRLGSMVGLDLSGHSCRVGMAQFDRQRCRTGGNHAGWPLEESDHARALFRTLGSRSGGRGRPLQEKGGRVQGRQRREEATAPRTGPATVENRRDAARFNTLN
ncbi:MAG: tyrosine-type recombinase/integrase, partial [Magnetococcales bacterium]|nr:tyrosine-type recombinase/integrase [Magnetococcales bacterium]MBF0151268.1 tyrosine-type recombinase/integrase [Magnetococcales bacterium]